MPAIKTDLRHSDLRKDPNVWNDSPGSVEKQFRFRQSFQSARPINGRPGTEVLHRVVEGAAQVLHEVCCLEGSPSYGVISSKIVVAGLP